MRKTQSLKLDQRIGLRLSQQQIRFVKLLELNAPELDNAVEIALEENPALEAVAPQEADEASKSQFKEEAPETQRKVSLKNLESFSRNASGENWEWEKFVSDDNFTLYDYLNDQLSERKLPEDIDMAARFIVGSLDSNGYLTRTDLQLANDMATSLYIDFPKEVIEEALNVVRSLEPHGVGAVNLRDCLLLQLEKMRKSPSRDIALEIVKHYFEAFSLKHSHKILLGLEISEQQLNDAIALILSLNPKPGAAVGVGIRHTAASIIPDFFISVEDGVINLQLNNVIPDLRIEESFETAVKELENKKLNKLQKKEREFVMSRYNDAREFIAILRQRQETLFSVMTAIVKLQKPYFLSEDVNQLRPMMIKDISAETGLDISVISRATNNKYASTPWGIFPLRFFFSDSKGKYDGDFTGRHVEQKLKKLIEKEDKSRPLSDEQIKKLLEDDGMPVSRRTVAKYREKLRIPSSRLRKNFINSIDTD